MARATDLPDGATEVVEVGVVVAVAVMVGPAGGGAVGSDALSVGVVEDGTGATSSVVVC